MNKVKSSQSPDRDYWTQGFRTNTEPSIVRHALARFTAISYLLMIKSLYSLYSLLFRNKRNDPDPSRGLTVFAIGPFFSENWSMAHMEALCKADQVERVYLFTPTSYKELPKLQYHTHSRRISNWFGAGIARAINAWKLARRVRPDLIIGYHLPWNGLMALLLAARTNSKSAYFSVGGPPELIGGGIYSEHALFSRLAREDAHVESLLTGLLLKFDAIFTMGSRSQEFFQSIPGIKLVFPIAVGINDSKFSLARSRDWDNTQYDLVTVGRLSSIKQTNLLIRIVAGLAGQGQIVQTAIVGDGDQMNCLKLLAKDLDISEQVHFLGWVEDVEAILQQSRLFVMTSSSEGLPHSLIEAMLTGLPAVVPDIGEIGDLLEHGLNGYLVQSNDVRDYEDRIKRLLSDPAELERFSMTARNSALQYTVDKRVAAWNRALRLI